MIDEDEYHPLSWGSLMWQLSAMFSIFGKPDQLAAVKALSRAAHKRISLWLTAMEAWARRKLLLAAADYEIKQTEPKPRAKRDAQQQQQPKRKAATRGFVALPPQPRMLYALRRKSNVPPLPVVPTAGLARRFAALIALAENPLPAIRRIARRKAKLEKLAARVAKNAPRWATPERTLLFDIDVEFYARFPSAIADSS